MATLGMATLGRLVLGGCLGMGVMVTGTPGAIAYDTPTARYANGEDVDLALMIREWRDRDPDIPVFACVCNQDVCNHSQSWPFRTFEEFQLTVTWGPSNANVAEGLGFICHDIEVGTRPLSLIPEPVFLPPFEEYLPTTLGLPSYSTSLQAQQIQATALPEDPAISSGLLARAEPFVQDGPIQEISAQENRMAASSEPTVEVLEDGRLLIGRWMDSTVEIDVRDWNINILDSVDCATFSLLDEQVMNAQRIVGNPAIDAETGAIAVAVELSYCALTTQSAVFVIDPQPGGYALYRVQVPGDRPFSDPFSSFALRTVSGLEYVDGDLQIRQQDASGAEVLLTFTPGVTPAGTYRDCVTLADGEAALCP